ncbi:cytidine deaminase [candidate division KSB3 bacterium]|uniref:Cytidine deaminase n=1 Tax=candidate division KSB3 bacterium TaxID=2044937 RepID=A0A2G6E491_9BACT|nr:MAG: cytidine deaminase [candidate division KSB3 bacterium]PIE29446.1 MAG: cytidine deaminase [candidate division KSB3 bacterium]
MKRPSWDEYFMNIAYETARRSNCCRRQIGAVLVRDRRIVSTGYNGTPLGVKNCIDGGCLRCASAVPSGQSYDTCICVHAEQNAIVLAARNGTSSDGCVLYTTLRPCFGCAKESVQAGIIEVVYYEDYRYPEELEAVYQNLIQDAGLTLRHLTAEFKHKTTRMR